HHRGADLCRPGRLRARPSRGIARALRRPGRRGAIRRPDMKGYLTIEAVGQTFSRGPSAATTEVLHDVRLVSDRGEYVSIIGHSGCGKSTLLNIVAGLLRATTGEVFLEGEVVDAPGPERAVVFQNHSLLPWLTTYENVQLAVDKVFRRRK